MRSAASERQVAARGFRKRENIAYNCCKLKAFLYLCGVRSVLVHVFIDSQVGTPAGRSLECKALRVNLPPCDPNLNALPGPGDADEDSDEDSDLAFEIMHDYLSGDPW